MRKKLLLAICLLSPGLLWAQCTPSASTVPGVTPSIADNLPNAYVGNYYSTVIQVRTPLDTTVNGTYATLTEVTITGVGNLPAGFTYACSPANCSLGPLSNGCMVITGTPTTAQIGNYLLDINITVKGKLYGIIPVTQSTKLSDYKIKISGPPVANFFADKNNICSKEFVTFSDQSSGYPTSFHWTFPGGNPSTSTQENPVVSYATPGNYTVTLIAGNPAGNGTKTKTSLIHVNAPPSAALVSYVSDTVCRGDSSFFEAVQGNNYTYEWYLNNTKQIGATKSIYYGKSTGDIGVKITKTTTGCSAFSQTKFLQVVKLNPGLTVFGNAEVCYPNQVTLKGNTAGTKYYKWYKNNSLIANATSSSYSAATSGKYKLEISNARGCKSISSEKNITIHSKPAVTISTTDATTFCAGGSAKLVAASPNTNATYQWSRNNHPINGAVLYKYVATQQGYYKVMATNQHGCTRISSRINLIVNCKLSDNEPDLNNEMVNARLAPNPAAGSTTLSVSFAKNTSATITLYDALGKMKEVLHNTPYEKGDYEFLFDLSDYTPGLYIINITTPDLTKNIRLINN